MQRNDAFIRREYNRALLPVMISVLAGVINTLIDTMFITRKLGSFAIAAVSLTLPVFFVFCTLGCLFAAGACILAADALGRHDVNSATRYYHSAMFMAVISGIIAFFVGVFASSPIAGFLCSDKSFLPLVRDYCSVSLMGAVFTIMSYIPSNFLNLAGKRRELAFMMGVMIATDVVLDYLFMYVADLGLKGAALASVLSTYLACVYGFGCLNEDRLFRFRLRLMSPYHPLQIFRLGSTQALGNLTDSVKMFLLNSIIFKAGGAGALAVWAVINSFSELSLCFISGIPSTGAPMIGVCRGSHDNDGIRLIVRQEMRNAAVASVGYLVIIVVLGRLIGMFFKVGDSVIPALACLGVSLVFESYLSILGSFFNVCTRVALSNTIMLLRSFFCALFFAFACLKSGILIWLFMPLGMGSALILTLLLTRVISARSRGRKHEYKGVLLLDDYMKDNNMISSFSIQATNENICNASEDITEFAIRNNMDKKLARRMGLAFEEVMTLMTQRAIGDSEAFFDVRLFTTEEHIGTSIMCPGKPYNPFMEAQEDDDMEFMGVRMINKMATDCRHLYVLGMNILEVDF